MTQCDRPIDEITTASLLSGHSDGEALNVSDVEESWDQSCDFGVSSDGGGGSGGGRDDGSSGYLRGDGDDYSSDRTTSAALFEEADGECLW